MLTLQPGKARKSLIVASIFRLPVAELTGALRPDKIVRFPRGALFSGSIRCGDVGVGSILLKKILRESPSNIDSRRALNTQVRFKNWFRVIRLLRLALATEIFSIRTGN